MKRKTKWTSILALPAILGVAAAIKSFNSDDPVEVTVVSPLRRDLSTVVTSNGKITPLDDFPVRAAFTGIVSKLLVKSGQTVKPGQLLLQMYDPYAPSRYASASSALQSATLGDLNLHMGGSQEDRINMTGDLMRLRLEKSTAEKQLQSLQELRSSGAASNNEVANAEEHLAVANSNLELQQSRMSNRYSKADLAASAGHVEDAKASLATAKAVLSNANVVSTIKGTVYALPVARYDFVTMGTDLLHVADLDHMQLHAFIDEPEIGKLSVNQPVLVSWEARPHKVWRGHVEQVPLSVTAMGVRNVGDCLISIDNTDGTLLPNTNVTVNITTDHRTGVETIPREALHVNGAQRFVFRLVHGKLLQTQIETGLINLDQVEVLSGVSYDDEIVLHAVGTAELRDGLKVKAGRLGQ